MAGFSTAYLSELGDLQVEVLHTQCHWLIRFRWVIGADVIGVDFSRYSRACLQSEFSEGFDMVFTSHGVLTWLSDLRVWAEQLAGCLRPGGNFYISEGHPLVWAFADELPVDDGGLRLGHSYLSQPKPSNFVESGSYADREAETEINQTTEWSWGIRDVVNALIASGLRIDQLNEHSLGFLSGL